MSAGCRLVELDLSDNAFGPRGIEGVVDLLKSPSCYSLQVLRLNNNGLGIGGGKVRHGFVGWCCAASQQQWAGHRRGQGEAWLCWVALCCVSTTMGWTLVGAKSDMAFMALFAGLVLLAIYQPEYKVDLGS